MNMTYVNCRILYMYGDTVKLILHGHKNKIISKLLLTKHENNRLISVNFLPFLFDSDLVK